MNKIASAVRRELVRVLRERYQASSGEERTVLLEELVRLSGYHRKYAIAVLNRRSRPLPANGVVQRRGL